MLGLGGLLGGLFAWIAFLGNIVSDERQKQMLAFIDAKGLQKPLFFSVPGIAFVILAVVALSTGTVVINNEGNDRSRHVEIREGTKEGTKGVVYTFN